jgi:hypothetical protein
LIYQNFRKKRAVDAVTHQSLQHCSASRRQAAGAAAMDGSSRLDSSNEDLGGMSSGDESTRRSSYSREDTERKIESGRKSVRVQPCALPPPF